MFRDGPIHVRWLFSQLTEEPGFRKIGGYELSPVHVVENGGGTSFHYTMAGAEKSLREMGRGSVHWGLYWRVMRPDGENHLARHIEDYDPTPAGKEKALAWLRKELGIYYQAP